MMRIGYLCRYSEEEIAFAQQAGFESMQLLVSPGDPLDPNQTDEATIIRAKEQYAKADIQISALGYYPNHLTPDKDEAQATRQHFLSLFDLAEMLEVDTIGTFAGRDPERDIADNIPLFQDYWAPIAKQAEDRGLQIGFENCPMFHYFPFRGTNIAYTPRAWELMFEAVDSPALGLEYDPSHLVCLLIDYLAVIRDWGHKIVHVHAKDAEVLWPSVQRNGILEPGAVRHRTPGMGVVDWSKVISTLIEYGYDGNLDIEGRHDPIYYGPRENEGLVISLHHLKQFIASQYASN